MVAAYELKGNWHYLFVHHCMEVVRCCYSLHAPRVDYSIQSEPELRAHPSSFDYGERVLATITRISQSSAASPPFKHTAIPPTFNTTLR